MTEHFGGLAILGALAAGWNHVKVAIANIAGFLFVSAELENGIYRAMNIYCWTHLRRTPFGPRNYSTICSYIKPLQRYDTVMFEFTPTRPTLFWNGWRPILIDRSQPGNFERMRITFIRGTMDLDTLLIAANKSYLRSCDEMRDRSMKSVSRFRVLRREGSRRNGNEQGYANPQGGRDDPSGPYTPSDLELHNGGVRLVEWTAAQIGMCSDEKVDPFEALAFPPEVTPLIKEIQHWIDSRRWYQKRGLPWRRGWLLYGEPGTGKTSLVRAVAQSLRIPVVVFDIASMSNHDFLASWEVALQEVPCIVLLEDMDNVFQGRTNRLGRNGGGLTFDCLLNCISGIQNAEGIFLVVTTNSIESIDPALGQPDPDRGTISTRPGRIDRALKLTVMTHECRMRLARRILEDCPDLIENMVAAGDGDTPAQFQERCASAALERHWMPNGEIANRQSSIAEVA